MVLLLLGDVHVDDALPEFVDRFDVVHELPDHMRGVVVQPEAGRGDLLEHAAPQGGRGRQVLAARPFVCAEVHGAVFDADGDATLLCMSNNGGPNLAKAFEIRLDACPVIPTDEGIDMLQAQLIGAVDHLLQVGNEMP